MPSLWNTSFNRLIDSSVSQTCLRSIRQGGGHFTNSWFVFIQGKAKKKCCLQTFLKVTSGIWKWIWSKVDFHRFCFYSNLNSPSVSLFEIFDSLEIMLCVQLKMRTLEMLYCHHFQKRKFQTTSVFVSSNCHSWLKSVKWRCMIGYIKRT